MALPDECRPTPQWRGFAMQDTRTPSSMGFRRRCVAWRVTLERPKVTKGLIPRLSALLRRVPSVHPFVPRHAPMGFDLYHPWRRSKSAADILVLAPNRAERCSSNSGLAPGPAALARRPASRPGQTGSPRRTTGGQNPARSPVNGSLCIWGMARIESQIKNF